MKSAEGALDLDERVVNRHVRVAELLTKLNKLEPALDRLKSAVELAPRDPELRRRTAEVMCLRGQWAGALDMVERGLDALDGTARTAENDSMRKSLTLTAAGLAQATLRPRRALAYLQAVLPETDPEYNQYANAALRAEVAFELNDMDQAEPAVEVMYRVAPDRMRTLAARSRKAGRRKDRAERDRQCRAASRAALQEALNQPPIVPTSTREEFIASYLSVAQAAIEARLWDEGLATLNKLAEILPETPLAYFKLAQIAILRGEAQCLYQDLDVIRHVPVGNALSETARTAVDNYFTQTLALLGIRFRLDISEDFDKWDDECRKTVGAWMARAKALFTPSEGAARLFETMLRMGNPGADEVAALIMAYRRCGNLPSALQAVEVGWQPAFDGRDACSHPLILSQLALAENNPAKALEHAGDALEAGIGQIDDWPPLPMLEYLVARLAAAQGNIPVAMQAMQQALVSWPEEPRWQELAAQIYLKPSAAEGLPDPVKALVHLEAAAALDPDGADNHLTIGKIYLSGGQVGRALPALEQASRLAPDRPDAWLALAQAQYAAGDLNASAASAERAVAGFSGDAGEPILSADETIQTAEAVVAKALLPAAENPELCDALLLRGRIALQTNNPRGAFSRAQLILRARPDHPEALYLIAHALEGLNRPADALSALERALAFSHDPLPMQLERIQLIRRSQGLEAGIAALDELAAAGSPPAPGVLALLAAWQNEAGRVELAIDTARQALQDETGDLSEADRAALNLLIGLEMRRTGQLDQAILHLSEAINHAPAELNAYLELGRAYQERREYRQALKVYQKAISVAPADFRSYYNAGLVLKDSKDYLAAEAMLRRAAQVAPNEVSIHRLLGAVVALNLVHNRRMTHTES